MQAETVTTTLELPGFRIVKIHGVVRDITVRSRSIVGKFFGALQSLFGGDITIYSQLCERARSRPVSFKEWHSVPDADSQLPLEAMPERFRADRIARSRSA